MLNHRPAVVVSLPFIAGILIGRQWDFSPWYLLASAGALFFLCAFVVFSDWQRGQYAVTVFLMPLVLLAGLYKITIDKDSPAKTALERFVGKPEPVVIRGMVIEPATMRANVARCIVEFESIEDEDMVHRVSASALVTFKRATIGREFLDSLGYGRRVEIYGTINRPGTARNPGEFDMRNYLGVNGIHSTIFIDDTANIDLLDRAGSWFLSHLVHPLRRSIARVYDRHIGGEEATFLKGLTIGDRSEIPTDVRTSFVNAGVMHILAVSGLHVGLITFILFGVFTVCRFPEKGRIIATCIVLVFYAFLTGSPPSVVRAVTMAIVVLMGLLMERRSDVVNSLAAAALFMLAIDARQLFFPGFQLSFAAVLSIVILYPKIQKVANILPENLRESAFIKGALALMSVSVAAAIGTLPFTSYYFGKISIIGLVANLIIVPLTGIVLALGFTTVLFSFLWETLGVLYAEACRFIASVLLQSVTVLGNLSFSHIDRHFSPPAMVAYYTAFGVLLTFRRKNWKKLALIVTVVSANVTVYLWLFGIIGAVDRLRVTFLDVGQGDAVFIELPCKERMLVDAGPRSLTYDAGGRIVVPYLRRRNIFSIDMVIVSHPHSDHLGGVPAVLRTKRVREVMDAGSVVSSVLFREFHRLIDSLQLDYRVLHAGDYIHSCEYVRVYVVHPSGDFAVPDSSRRVNVNNQSVVVKVVYGKTSLLLSGDAEKEAEEQMVRMYGDFLRSDLLKVGHHGSITSSTSEFLRAVSPAIGVISVGERNKFRHPSPLVLERLEQVPVRVYRTDQHNAAVFVSDGLRWREAPWR